MPHPLDNTTWLRDMAALEAELEARLANVRRMVANVRAGLPPWP